MYHPQTLRDLQAIGAEFVASFFDKRLRHGRLWRNRGRSLAGDRWRALAIYQRRRIGRQLVQRASHWSAAGPQNVGIDHGGLHPGMAEQFLESADVVATPSPHPSPKTGEGCFDDRERMAKGMGRRALADTGALDGGAKSTPLGLRPSPATAGALRSSAMFICPVNIEK